MAKLNKKKISDYTPDDRNINKGSEYGARLLEKSLQEVGLGRSVLADKEEWKDIPGYEDQYQASTHGRVRSKDIVQSFKSRWGSEREYRRKGRIRKTKISRSGYVLIVLKHSETHHVGRLVAMTFLPGNFEGCEVNHKDGNKQNNHISNLEWVTKSQNQLHRYYVLNKMPPSQLSGIMRAKELKQSRIKKYEDLLRENSNTAKEISLLTNGELSQQQVAKYRLELGVRSFRKNQFV